MGNMNPMQLLMALKNGDPQQVAAQIAQQNPNNPIVQQVYQMGVNNDVDGLNNFAKQYFSQQGRDFNKELNTLMNAVKNM